MSKSEIRKQKSQIILADGDSFNEVDDRSNVGKISVDKRVVRGQMISSEINRQSNEPDYSPDILDDGKCNKLFYGSKAASSYCKKGKYKIPKRQKMASNKNARKQTHCKIQIYLRIRYFFC